MTTVTADTQETTEITLTLPVTLVAELQELIPEGQQQQFLIDLLAREIRRKKLHHTIKRTAGAWKPENHPEFNDPDGIESYVRRLRETQMPRTWEEIIAEDIDD